MSLVTLYAMPVSGNCWKVAWMLRLCQVPHRLVLASYDGSNGSIKTRSPEYLQKNPNGQAPLLELEDGRRLAESNAILLYLAETYQTMLPTLSTTTRAKNKNDDDTYARALVYQWLFFEQYSHEPYIAVRRANIIFNRPYTTEVMQTLLEKGEHALRIMDQQLSVTPYLAGPEPTVADISLFAYTHVADQGGFDMDKFPAVQTWLERIKSLPNYGGLESMQGNQQSA